MTQKKLGKEFLLVKLTFWNIRTFKLKKNFLSNKENINKDRKKLMSNKIMSKHKKSNKRNGCLMSWSNQTQERVKQK